MKLMSQKISKWIKSLDEEDNYVNFSLLGIN